MRWRRPELHRWERWKDGSFEVVPVPGGVIVDFRIAEVEATFVSTLRGKSRLIFDAGYRWIYFTPLTEKHSVILALDDTGTPLQLYVDITQGNRVDPDGLPAIDDVFLDVLAWIEPGPDGPPGDLEVIDQDELDAALAAGGMTPEQHAAAWAEARKVVELLKAGAFPALATIRDYLRRASP